MAWSDSFIGQASVIDGDTLEIHGTRIRLWGVDAPESQLCRGEDSLQYRCGAQAANHSVVDLCEQDGSKARTIANGYTSNISAENASLNAANSSKPNSIQILFAYGRVDVLPPDSKCLAHVSMIEGQEEAVGVRKDDSPA